MPFFAVDKIGWLMDALASQIEETGKFVSLASGKMTRRPSWTRLDSPGLLPPAQQDDCKDSQPPNEGWRTPLESAHDNNMYDNNSVQCGSVVKVSSAMVEKY